MVVQVAVTVPVQMISSAVEDLFCRWRKVFHDITVTLERQYCPSSAKELESWVIISV